MTDVPTAQLSLLGLNGLRAAWPLLLGVALKTALLLAAGALCARVLQRLRASASARHLVWTFALVGALALPLVSAVGPSWEARVPRALLPGVLAPASSSAPPASGGPEQAGRFPLGPAKPDRAASALPKSRSTNEAQTNAAASAGGERAPASGAGADGEQVAPAEAFWPETKTFGKWSWTAGLTLFWLAGFAAALARLLVGTLRAWRLARRSESMPDEAWDLLGSVREALPAWRRVRVRFAEDLATPLTWGLFRPLVVLPQEAATEWSDERRRAALLHELAHVRRFDTLTQLLAELACAVHWMNPLAWHAARRMRHERERACDMPPSSGQLGELKTLLL